MVKRYSVISDKQVIESLRPNPETEGAKISLVYGGETTRKSFAAKWVAAPGTRLPPEGWKWHDEEEVEYIVAGELQLWIADEKGYIEAEHRLKAGDFLYIAAGTKHAAKSVGAESCVGILFNPKPYDLRTRQKVSQLYDR